MLKNGWSISLFKKVLVVAIIFTVTAIAGLGVTEICLQRLGYGNPPLYSYDPAVGYVLKPNQTLKRVNDCKVLINNEGMRSPDISPEKPVNVFRILLVGDSVAYGGSYIDQQETFCYLAEQLLSKEMGKKFQILNAAANAYGPQNVLKYLETRGTYDADLVVVYFPWGNLRRDFTNFYIVPFWSTNPHWALNEFFRHMVWGYFGTFSQEWKEIDHFKNEKCMTQNLDALCGIRHLCEMKGTPVIFLWSPYLTVLTGKDPDVFADDKKSLSQKLPDSLSIDLSPEFARHTNISSLFVDGCHYSKEGHAFAATLLCKYVLETQRNRNLMTKPGLFDE
jgi:hypothetical protein